MLIEDIREQLNKYPGLSNIMDELVASNINVNELSHYGMVLFGPDAFKQGEVLRIIDYLKRNGFVLISVKTQKITKTEAENLFLATSTCVQLKKLKWWMIQDSSSAGMFCAAIFYSPTSSEHLNCLCELNLHKGQSNPLKNRPGKIRYDFKAINTCLNLVHIPDTYGDFFKDTSPFYSVSDIVDIVNHPTGNLAVKEETNKDIYIVELYSKMDACYSFEFSIYKVKYLLAAKLADYFTSTSLFDFIIHLKKTCDAVINEESRTERNSIYICNSDRDKEEIKRIQNELYNRITQNGVTREDLSKLITAYQLTELLLDISVPERYAKSYSYFFDHVEVLGIIVDGYDRLIINTTLLQWE